MEFCGAFIALKLFHKIETTLKKGLCAGFSVRSGCPELLTGANFTLKQKA